MGSANAVWTSIKCVLLVIVVLVIEIKTEIETEIKTEIKTEIETEIKTEIEIVIPELVPVCEKVTKWKPNVLDGLSITQVKLLVSTVMIRTTLNLKMASANVVYVKIKCVHLVAVTTKIAIVIPNPVYVKEIKSKPNAVAGLNTTKAKSLQ